MIEYMMYSTTPDGANKNWIDSVTRKTNNISLRSLIKNAKEILIKNKIKNGIYNIDIIKGGEKQIQSGSHYDYCFGYAIISHNQKETKVILYKGVKNGNN